jgi:DNA repair protein RadD
LVTLRPYQEDALQTIMGCIPQQKTILMQAATGAGKTIIFCELIKRLLSSWPNIRIGILAHRRELITQAWDKLITVWPEAPIGIACASVSNQIETEPNVIIGSVQTLVRRTEETAPFDLIIVDEAHRIPAINQKSQYSQWLDVMQQYNPKVRILGVTATPFRLGHGYIYGSKCKNGNENLFQSLDYQISISKLQADGYLCSYRAKELDKYIRSELRNVKLSAGEYNLGALSDLMSKEIHIGSAVNAVNQYAHDRKHIVVFCVTIDHATELQKAFDKAKIPSAVIHSKMNLFQRDLALRSFADGFTRVICNVGILTEGWDSPHTDCILMCRPTKSPGLYVQMTGRGLRPHTNKTDVLILDLAGNCAEHGDPNSPTVATPNGKQSDMQLASPMKACPGCNEMVSVGTKICPACGYEWPVFEVQIDHAVQMKDVSWQPETKIVEVTGYDISDFISRNNNRMLKLSMFCVPKDDPSVFPFVVNNYFDFEGQGSTFGKTKAVSAWELLCGSPAPETMDEAVHRQGELDENVPRHIEAIRKGEWWNVKRWKPIVLEPPYDDEVPF